VGRLLDITTTIGWYILFTSLTAPQYLRLSITVN